MAVRMGFRVAWLANEAREGAPHATHAACRGYRLCAGGWRTVSAAGMADVVDDPSTAAPGRRLQPGRSQRRRTECQNVGGSSVKMSFVLEISRPPLLPRESTCQATGEDFSG